MAKIIDTGSYMTAEEFRRAYGADAPSLDIGGTMERAGVPRRFQQVRPDTARAADLGEGRGLYLFGDVGTHKTTMACAVLAGWIKLGHGGALYASSVDLAAELMPTSKVREQRLAQVKAAKLLVLDDLGKEPPTPWILATLFSIVDARWSSGTQHTIVTAQLAPSELAGRLAERGDEATAKAIVSRLAGMCSLIRCTGQDGRIYGRRG
nr:MAG TPA: replicative helicase [Caudoviricetes sp.]